MNSSIIRSMNLALVFRKIDDLSVTKKIDDLSVTNSIEENYQKSREKYSSGGNLGTKQ